MHDHHNHDHGHEPREESVFFSPDFGHLHAEVRQPSPGKVKRLRWALIITGVIMVVELAGGILSNSLALVSDAGHMLTDILALAMAYLATLIATRPADRARTFGYFRAEVLAALINGLLLFAVTGFIFYEAVVRVVRPQKVDTVEMLVVAVVGLVANVASILLLAGGSGSDLNLKSAFIHVVYDAVSSVAVVGGALIIQFTGVTQVDPVLSVVIGTLILIWAVKIVRESAGILLEATPAGVNPENIHTDMLRVPGVQGVHDIHVWQITTDMHVMTAHVVVGNVPMAECSLISERLNQVLRQRHSIGHATLQFECDVSPDVERASSPREWQDRGL